MYELFVSACKLFIAPYVFLCCFRDHTWSMTFAEVRLISCDSHGHISEYRAILKHCFSDLNLSLFLAVVRYVH